MQTPFSVWQLVRHRILYHFSKGYHQAIEVLLWASEILSYTILNDVQYNDCGNLCLKGSVLLCFIILLLHTTFPTALVHVLFGTERGAFQILFYWLGFRYYKRHGSTKHLSRYLSGKLCVVLFINTNNWNVSFLSRPY